MSSALFRAARVVAGHRVLAPGWVLVEDGTITDAGHGAGAGLPGTRIHEFGDSVLVPGFIDIHCHGGGERAFTEGAAAARVARQAHLRCGTTAQLASLVTASLDGLLEQVRELRPLVAAGDLAGIHLEGPWLSPRRRGAHEESLLRAPQIAEIDALLEAGAFVGEHGPGQAIRMVTIAPELPGALPAIRHLAETGIAVAVGHTDADAATVDLAIDAGATVATHLFNAMRPVHHREPGPIVALMRDPRVVLELIADGVHLHERLPDDVEAAVGADRIVYVTDAMAAAGAADGDYRIGGLAVEVRGGVARLSGQDTIAGSTATMDQVFRSRALRNGRDRREKDLVAAVRLTSENPARVLGLEDAGRIAAGARADMVVLGADLAVREVIVAGECAERIG